MTSAGVRVVVDPPDLDVATVHRWLSTDAYWAIGRPLELVEQAVAGSLNFAAYDGDAADNPGDMIGYARVVTDRATFAWICDVYVERASRGRGVGRALVAAIHETLAELGVKRAVLATDDAHDLYAAYGFEPLTETRKWMLRSYDRQPGAAVEKPGTGQL